MNDIARLQDLARSTGSETLSAEQMQSFWTPFTANRDFKSAPRLLDRAEGMHYYTPEGREILDGTAGLWLSLIHI